MRVLVVKTSSMGDVVHTLPALTDAMRVLPEVRFDWAVEEAFVEIPAWHRAVDRVIPVALRRWRKSPFLAWRNGEWRAYREMLRERSYDAVIDAQGLIKSALMVTQQARGPRHGLDGYSAREPLAARFYNRMHRVEKGQHAVERVRQLFAKALGYELPQARGDFGIAGHFAQAACAPYLVFLHATTRADKHWPESRWIALAAMAQEAGWAVRLFWNNEAEGARARRIASGAATVEVMPRLGLGDVARQLAGAAGVVSVDTGLSHLAGALGRPNVTLFGPTSPGLVGGYGENQICLSAADFVASGASNPHDLANLTPEIVWPRLVEAMEAANQPPT